MCYNAQSQLRASRNARFANVTRRRRNLATPCADAERQPDASISVGADLRRGAADRPAGGDLPAARLAVVAVRGASRRENLLTLIPGDPRATNGGEFLLWDVHQDTVPVEGMTIEPFAGEVRDGRVYGRGACDVKGSMAAMLAALSRRSKLKAGPLPTILLACTVNEECGYTGAQALSRMLNGSDPSGAVSLIPRLPDAAIVAEPTCLNVVIAHQGQVRWRCHTIGRAAHTSRPDAGVNAIYAMAQVVQAIERYHRELSTTAPEHPLCGRPSVCVSTIRGGVGINTVPERATIEIDRRLAPGESPDAAYQSSGWLRRQARRHRPLPRRARSAVHAERGPEDDRNRQVAERLADVVREHRPNQPIGRRAIRHRCGRDRCDRNSDRRVRPGLDRPGPHGGRVHRNRRAAARDGDLLSRRLHGHC